MEPPCIDEIEEPSDDIGGTSTHGQRYLTDPFLVEFASSSQKADLLKNSVEPRGKITRLPYEGGEILTGYSSTDEILFKGNGRDLFRVGGLFATDEESTVKASFSNPLVAEELVYRHSRARRVGINFEMQSGRRNNITDKDSVIDQERFVGVDQLSFRLPFEDDYILFVFTRGILVKSCRSSENPETLRLLVSRKKINGDKEEKDYREVDERVLSLSEFKTLSDKCKNSLVNKISLK